MPSPLDWLGVNQQPPTSYLNPAVPFRTYGLTAADAVSQGRQALGNVQAAASYADLLRQQALAPLQQQVAQQQLQQQVQTQPMINQGREELVQSLSSLDPASEDYLAQRRDAVMRNPYGLADPIVQHVLRANDQAYDDYISTRRLQMYGNPRPLTASQQATLQHQISKVTDAMTQASQMGNTEMSRRYAEELQSLQGLLSGSTGAAGATPAPGIAAQAPVPGASPANNELAVLPEKQRWQSSKETLLSAVAQEAQDLKTTPTAIMSALESDGGFADEFFKRRFGAAPDSQVFSATKGRNMFASSKVSWKNILESLRDDESLVNKAGVTRRDLSNLPPVNATKDAPANFTPGQWHLEVITE